MLSQELPLGIAMWELGYQPSVLDHGPPIGRGFEDHLQVPELVAVEIELRETSGSDPIGPAV